MSHKNCEFAILLMQHTSSAFIRGHFRVTSYFETDFSCGDSDAKRKEYYLILHEFYFLVKTFMTDLLSSNA